MIIFFLYPRLPVFKNISENLAFSENYTDIQAQLHFDRLYWFCDISNLFKDRVLFLISPVKKKRKLEKKKYSKPSQDSKLLHEHQNFCWFFRLDSLMQRMAGLKFLFQLFFLKKNEHGKFYVSFKKQKKKQHIVTPSYH